MGMTVLALGYILLALAAGQYALVELLGPWCLALWAAQALLGWRLCAAGPPPAWARSPWSWLAFAAACLALYALLPRTGMDSDVAGYAAAARDLWAGRGLTRGDYPWLASLYFGLIGAPARDLASYELVLAAVNLGWLLLAAGLLRGMARRRGRADLAAWLPWLILSAPLAAWLTMARFDVLPLCLCLLALRAWEAERPALAAGLLALGFWVKLFPLLLLPPLLLALLARRDWRGLAGALGAVAAVLAAPWAWLGRDQILGPIWFQSGRGLTGQAFIYQLYHGLMPNDLPGRPWEPVAVEWGAFAPDVLALVLYAALAIWYALAARDLLVPRPPGEGPGRRARAMAWAAGAVLLVILANRMYSDQFMLWALLLAPVAALGGPARRAGRGRLLGALFVAAAANPLYFALGGLEGWPVAARGLAWCAYGWLLLVLAGAGRPGRLRGRELAALALALAAGGLGLWGMGLDRPPLWLPAALLALGLAGLALARGRAWLRLALAVALAASLGLGVADLARGPWLVVEVGPDQRRPDGTLTCCRYPQAPPGRLAARFRVGSPPAAPSQGRALVLEAVSQGGREVLARREVAWGEMPPAGREGWLGLPLVNREPWREVEVRARTEGAGGPVLHRYLLGLSWLGERPWREARAWLALAAPHWSGLVGLTALFLAGALLLPGREGG